MMQKAVFIFGAALLSASALQFDLEGGRTKCIAEVLSRNEVGKGTYSLVSPPDSYKSQVDIRVTKPNNEVEHQETDFTAGTFGFMAADAGAHKVCFMNRGRNNWRINFLFQSGVDVKDYSDLATKDHLKPLEIELRKIEDRIDGIHREMMYQREREEVHRNTNESTNSRVVGYSLLTIFVVLGVALMQATYLFGYLKKIKILS